MIISAISENS